ncbi:MAG: succinyl-CoA synthetase subunit alpha [Syntrophorhabdus sp. PtaU1.Bin002]|nr:MAG: succinyl-CoA synthetase subunit alpha [Syntrophorhabdus sp. PtaU1.Bin002]
MDEKTSDSTERTRAYNALFRPKNIVIIGASDNLSKPGGKVLKNILDHGYAGVLRVVNPGADSISGVPSFKSVDDLPDTPELAIVAIPAPFVIPTLENLATRGTKAVIVLTSGFGEKDEKGKEEEERMRLIADSARMILIGPNCSGFMTPHYSGKFAGLIPDLKRKSVDIISGSGATVDFIMEQAVYRGLSFCNVVNVGNSAQTGVEDLVALYDENYGEDSAPILMVYLESLKKPGLFLKHARQLTEKGCSIVGIKSGVTGSGARAAASHTGAMATDEVTVEALFRKAGIIRVRSKVEMVDVACVLAATQGHLMKGNRVCIISDAGGPGVMLSDELERQGVEVPILKDGTQKKLGQILPPESSVTNPIDCLPTRTASQIKEILRIIEEEEKESIDIIAVMVGNPGMSENDELYGEISRAIDTSGIPVIPVLSSTTTCAGLIQNFTAQGKYYFQDEVPLGAAIGQIVHRPRLWEPSPMLLDYDRQAMEGVLSGREGALEPATVKELLIKAGFSFPRQIEVSSEEGLLAACENIGYPLAMKVIGPLHKSDVGGVRVGISQEDGALSAWNDLLAIKGATGVLIQEMVTGIEVILGASRADDLGHLVMFGLGGIYTEVFKDVRFVLSPLAKEECFEMIRAIRGYPILEGVRGEKGVAVERIADYLERLGRLVTDFPAIKEIDINPLKGSGTDLFVVDARIIVG